MNDDPGKNSQFFSKIALDQTTGLVAATWYDCRRDTGTGSPTDTDGKPNTDAEVWGTVIVDAHPVPNAPSELRATATSKNRVTLTWKDNSSDETGFKIERKTGLPSDPSTYVVIATVPANTTTYTDRTVAPSTTYTYRVRATSSFGNSAPSNEASVTSSGGKLQVKRRLAFGTVRVGRTSLHQIALQNLAPRDSLVVGFSLPDGPFSLVDDDSPQVIPGKERLVLNIRFTPTVKGAAKAILTLTSSDPQHATVKVTLTGHGK